MLIESLLLLQSCFSDHKKASNLEAYVEWFNRLSYLVATEICMVSNAHGEAESAVQEEGAEDKVQANISTFCIVLISNKHISRQCSQSWRLMHVLHFVNSP